MHPVLKELEEASSGLYFLSESESPFDPFTLPPGTKDIQRALVSLSGATGGNAVEQVAVDHFFRNHTRPDGVQPETAPRFNALVARLQKSLRGVQVYRIGTGQVTAFIGGQLQDGTFCGLRTKLIET